MMTAACNFNKKVENRKKKWKFGYRPYKRFDKGNRHSAGIHCRGWPHCIIYGPPTAFGKGRPCAHLHKNEK